MPDSLPLRLLRRLALLVLLVLLVPAFLRAQGTPPPADTTAASDAIKVFLDCRGDTNQGCATEFFVLELPYVTWTRDRLFADVQFLVTTIQTGSGAFQYTVTALGRGRFDGRADTSVVNTLPNESEDGIRRKLSARFALLLVPYVRATSAATRLRVVYDAPANARQASPQSVKDRWNFFVLQVEANGFMNTESRQTFANIFSDIRVRRVTERNAIRFGVNQSVRYNKFEIDDTTTVSNTIRNGLVFVRGVKALGPRLSAGFLTNVGFNEFNNTKLFWRAAPVIEYNLFPWKQATSQQIAISYGVGPRYFRWTQPTIFGRSSEWRAQQELVVGSDIRKSWGSVNVSSRYASFIPDVKKWNLSINGQTNLNLVKGLSFNFGGGASLIRDQIFLAAEGQTPEQILTQQRALASNYSVFVFTGLSYSFGSIYNSVVNPRLDFFNLGGNN
ncbi:MAG: hypothetical protein V4813_06190 [Gemmatimonadota bacterium]